MRHKLEFYKIFSKDGIEFSGGESLKLAISLALYKDSKLIILDEPTASLDPISEHNIYSRINELLESKTVIYIFHRLSSCKFSDKVHMINPLSNPLTPSYVRKTFGISYIFSKCSYIFSIFRVTYNMW